MDKFEFNMKIEEASKLLYLGIKGDIVKKDSSMFKTLYKKYRSDPEFRTIFEIIANGFTFCFKWKTLINVDILTVNCDIAYGKMEIISWRNIC